MFSLNKDLKRKTCEHSQSAKLNVLKQSTKTKRRFKSHIYSTCLIHIFSS